MATSGKGGFRNNGQPRVTLKRGWTRVAQLKAAIRAMDRAASGPLTPEASAEVGRIAQSALDGTYTE